MTVELDGDVGCCNLLVRAVQMCAQTNDAAAAAAADDDGDDGDDDDGDPSLCYIAQELRRVDDIDGSVMRLMLTHSSVEHSAVSGSSAAVQQLLRQFPSVLPASLPQFLANPSALPAMSGEFRSADILYVSCSTMCEIR